jgi:LysR family hydrogen peroxide-inducible transcriptional activator
MNGLSLKQLRYFHALARHGHFGRAAADCAISQPALSVQIRDLEDLVGAPLVERAARSIRLTELGERFAERVRVILQAVDELGTLSRAARAPFTGRFRLGLIPTVAPYLLPRIMKGLGEAFPGLEVTPREAVTRKLTADLAEGGLDAAIVALPVAEPALDERLLFREDFLLVRPAKAAREPVPPVEALAGMRLLLLEEGHCFRDQALAFCRLSSAPPRDIIEGSALSTLVQMVGAEIGVTLIPEIAAPMEARSAAVSISPVPSPAPTRSIGIVWRRTNPLAREIAVIAETLDALRLGEPAGG